jgi:hypothetical protein
MNVGSANSYSVFGGVLRTTLDLPELHAASAESASTWTLNVHDSGAPVATILSMVREELQGGVSVNLERLEGGAYRLTYSDTGTFNVSVNGSVIDWYRAPQAREDLARTDILGRVLALAARASGIATSNGVLMLHASAVMLSGKVVGFLAPKFFGKSTLACALTDNGAQLVTDDALAVRSRHRVECAPGIPAIRLRREAAMHLRGTDPNPVADDGTEWRHLERRGREEVMTDWQPLGALYVLDPRPSAEMPVAATRTHMIGAQAPMALVAFAKLGGLLSGPLAVDYLGHAASIASQIPICVLQCARDMQRLDEVAGVISNWHRD